MLYLKKLIQRDQLQKLNQKYLTIKNKSLKKIKVTYYKEKLELL